MHLMEIVNPSVMQVGSRASQMGSKAMLREEMTASKRFALEMQQKVPLAQRPMGYGDITKGIAAGVDRAAGRQVAEV